MGKNTCNTFAIKVRVLETVGSGTSSLIPNNFGPRIAGQKNLKKINPETTIYRIFSSWANLSFQILVNRKLE